MTDNLLILKLDVSIYSKIILKNICILRFDYKVICSWQNDMLYRQNVAHFFISKYI